MTDTAHIRNFSIIAHIDHGKSTLADRLIQLCGAVSDRDMVDQILDSMDLERERGITIKAQSVSLQYKARDGQRYQLNMIDTPGHVDFSYEVSRSLAACDGALLVVDAAQGVEAQSVANCYTAIEQGVEVVPVLNKIDLPSAEPERVIDEIEDVIGIDAQDAVRASAKTGEGIDDILEAVIARALSLNPADRFQSGGQFASALRSVPPVPSGSAPPIIAPPGRAPRPLGAQPRRRAQPVAGASKRDYERPQGSGIGAGPAIVIIGGIILLALAAGGAFALFLSRDGGDDGVVATPTAGKAAGASRRTLWPTPGRRTTRTFGFVREPGSGARRPSSGAISNVGTATRARRASRSGSPR